MYYDLGCAGYNGTTTWNYGYNGTTGVNGSIQNWTAPCTGKFKLEAWGAQGQSATTTFIGGYGGYSVGATAYQYNKKLYIGVGGTGTSASCTDQTSTFYLSGGYNGGSDGSFICSPSAINRADGIFGGGGGATHMSTSNTLLSSTSKSSLLIVAGGGGGGACWGCHHSTDNSGVGGNGGGYIGGGATSVGAHIVQYNRYSFGGTQSSGGCTNNGDPNGVLLNTVGCGEYGKGGVARAGGGGGLYGGAGAVYTGGGGGSGYIGNANLISYGSVTKHMTGYNLTNTTNSADIRTQTTTQVTSAIPAESDKARAGHGYARITFLSV